VVVAFTLKPEASSHTPVTPPPQIRLQIPCDRVNNQLNAKPVAILKKNAYNTMRKSAKLNQANSFKECLTRKCPKSRNASE
jgi:hypothetical protein